MLKAIFSTGEPIKTSDRVFIEWANEDCKPLGVMVDVTDTEIIVEAPGMSSLLFFANRLGHRGITTACKSVKDEKIISSIKQALQ